MSRDPQDLLTRELFLRSALPDLTSDAAARLIELLEPLEAPAGTLLFQAGDASTRFYFVSAGEVVMESADQPELRFGPRSIVGIIDATLDRPHRRSARATRDSSLLVARSSAWFDLMEDDPQLSSGTTVSLARQVHAQWLERGGLNEAVSDAPPPPATPLELYEKLLALRDAQLLRAAGLQATASLAEVAEELRLEAGEALFEEGGANRLYLLVHGAVEISRRAPPLTATHRAGSLIGGPAALAHELPDYSARALTAAVVLRISDDDYYDQAETHPELVRSALAYLLGVREALLQTPAPEDPAGR